MQAFHLVFFSEICKFTLEIINVVELARAKEIQQVEQLFKVVWQRRASQQQLVADLLVVQRAEEPRISIGGS